jgi:hypothetical protein
MPLIEEANVPCFYLHLRCGREVAQDLEGIELPDVAAAHLEAVRIARSLWGDMLFRSVDPTRFVIDIADATGKVIENVAFSKIMDML